VLAIYQAMSRIRKIFYKFAPTRLRLAWDRRSIQRGYGKEIASARNDKRLNDLAHLEGAYRFEMELQQEQEDAFLTSNLLRRIRRLRLPIPPIRDTDGNESIYWYEGRQTGGWYLSDNGVRHLMQEIRQEVKERHESRAHYIVWLTALTGIIGSVTGLVAVVQANG